MTTTDASRTAVVTPSDTASIGTNGFPTGTWLHTADGSEWVVDSLGLLWRPGVDAPINSRPQDAVAAEFGPLLPAPTVWDDPAAVVAALGISQADVNYWLTTVGRGAHDRGHNLERGRRQPGCPGCPVSPCLCGDPDCREFAEHRALHAGSETTWREAS